MGISRVYTRWRYETLAESVSTSFKEDETAKPVHEAIA